MARECRSLFPEHGKDTDTLLRRADAAMDHAKLDREKDYCFYQPDLKRLVPELPAVWAGVPTRGCQPEDGSSSSRPSSG